MANPLEWLDALIVLVEKNIRFQPGYTSDQLKFPVISLYLLRVVYYLTMLG